MSKITRNVRNGRDDENRECHKEELCVEGRTSLAEALGGGGTVLSRNTVRRENSVSKIAP